MLSSVSGVPKSKSELIVLQISMIFSIEKTKDLNSIVNYYNSKLL